MSKIENPFPQLLYGAGGNFLRLPVTQKRCIFLKSCMISLPLVSRYLIEKKTHFYFYGFARHLCKLQSQLPETLVRPGIYFKLTFLVCPPVALFAH